MDSSFASNKFVLPRSLEPFKPEPQPLADVATPEMMPQAPGLVKPSETTTQANAQAQQAALQQGNSKLEQALFNQFGGLQAPLFTQLAYANVKTMAKPSSAEKSESQQKAFEQPSGDDGDAGAAAGMVRPQAPSIRPKPLQNFSYKAYFNQASLTLDEKESQEGQ